MWVSFWNSVENLIIAFKFLTWATILIPAFLGSLLYSVNSRVRELQTSRSKQEIERIEDQAKSVVEQVRLSDEQVKKLNEQNEGLTRQLSIAREQASELQLKARNAERGVIDIYDFNGARRQSVAGKSSVFVGAETSVFQQILKLYADKNWLELATVCEEQIKNTPTWLTPYLYSGIAKLNLRSVAAGRSRLEFVAERAGNDPNYADASRILSELKAASD